MFNNKNLLAFVVLHLTLIEVAEWLGIDEAYIISPCDWVWVIISIPLHPKKTPKSFGVYLFIFVKVTVMMEV